MLTIINKYYFPFFSSSSVLGVTFEEILISKVLPDLLKECSSIITKERWSDLSLLYGLVKSAEGGRLYVIQQFEQYMKQGRETLLKLPSPKSPDEFVNRIFDYHAKNKEIIEQVFGRDSIFIRVLDETCICVINHNPNPKTRCPSLDLVRYLFALLFYFYKICLIVLTLLFVCFL